MHELRALYVKLNKWRNRTHFANKRHFGYMKQVKKIFSKEGNPMLSAREAATRLSCAQDYIGKLCREGKLEGSQVKGAWFVDEASLKAFDLSRAAARETRSQELSAQRRTE